MQQQLLILQGIPGSGKTTFGKELALANPLTHIRVCRDDTRNQFGKYWVPEREALVTIIEKTMVYEALKAGYNVILDATNLNPKTLKVWEDMVAHLNSVNNQTSVKIPIIIEYKRFDTPLEECLRRDALRGADSRGEKVVLDFHKRYCTAPTEPFKVEPIVQDPTLPRIIIVDIDGTVAKVNGRGHYEYHKVGTDLPNKPVIERVEDYLSSGRGEVVFLSGREEVCRHLTLDWLFKYIQLGPNELTLFMRPTGDHRKDCIVKKEIFDREIKDKFFVEFCLDDRNQVVDLWRAMGLTVHQVCSREEGNF